VVIPDLVASVTLPVAHGVPDAVRSFHRIGMSPGGQVRPDTGIGHEGEVLVEVPKGDRVELKASGEQMGSGVGAEGPPAVGHGWVQHRRGTALVAVQCGGSQCLVLAAGVDKAEHRRALLVGGL
jgi:hypothetical protein